METAKKKKYTASDKAILGIGYVLLGAFVLSILIPLLYVVILLWIPMFSTARESAWI